MIAGSSSDDTILSGGEPDLTVADSHTIGANDFLL
jgi:hypothetical protein